MTTIVFLEGRGAIVSDPDKFLATFSKKGKGGGLRLCPLGLAYGVELYSFDCRFKGLEADQWAWMWLKGQHSARQAGSYVPTPCRKRVSKFTDRAIRKALVKEVSTKNSQRKKGATKMISNTGSWFLDEEKSYLGVGAYRPK